MVLLLGNLAAFAGCMIMVAIGFVRKKEKILAAQCVQFGFLALGNLILGATAGFISGVVSIVRNLIFTRTKGTTALKLGFIAVQLLLTAFTWKGQMIECIPVLATVLFTWFLDTKSDVLFKLVIITGQAMWACYDWYYLNIVAFAFDLLTIGSNLVGLWMIRKTK